jgi:RNA 3'-terminal phosphate cyclase (ATP)
MIVIDGSTGEGGGQILRTSLALALVTGQPFEMRRIRAARSKPGLQRQHLTAVLAASEVGAAEVRGAELNSQHLIFAPKGIRAGEYHFRIGTAGSASLVLQTVLPALAMADGPSRLLLEGGTHNSLAPPFEFLQKAYLPLLARMGPRVEVTLERHGFYPAGGGRVSVSVVPKKPWAPLELFQRGQVIQRRVRAIVSRLPRHIAEREVRTALDRLEWPRDCGLVEEVESAGPGNAVVVEVGCEHVTEVFTGFGQRGVPAEQVASHAADEAKRYLAADVPVGEHLADQLLLPMAISGGGGFRTLAPSFHTTTNIATLANFLEVQVATVELGPDVWEIRVAR